MPATDMIFRSEGLALAHPPSGMFNISSPVYSRLYGPIYNELIIDGELRFLSLRCAIRSCHSSQRFDHTNPSPMGLLLLGFGVPRRSLFIADSPCHP